MARIHWYFDPISPFVWLQWPAVRALAAQHEVLLRPILLAGLLDHHGQKGPAEIPSKRAFTYRYVQWLAAQRAQPLRFPPAHPFNPLCALRLVIAAGCTENAAEAVLRWIWEEGRAADSIEAIAPLARQQMGVTDVAAALGEPDVKQRLREFGEDARAAGVFGVPTLVIDGELFWGEDATRMAQAFLSDRALFDSAEMRRLKALPIGVRRPGT